MSGIEPSEDPQYYKWGVFYFNKNDSRIVVPKRIKFMGWTLNFARLESYLLIVVIIWVVWLTNKYSGHY